MLEGRHLHVAINGQNLLDDVSIQVTPGEVVAVLGPNGAGKSTLLKALCGDRVPTNGSVLMDGLPLTAWDKKDCARVRAVLPQHSNLNFSFTVLEVALMGRVPHQQGVDCPADYAIARAALREAGVDHLADRLYTTLSGGESQRVHLGRVLAQIWEASNDSPRYLLLDEPTASLDLAYQHHTLTVARRFSARNVAVLVILHDLNLAAQYADRILLLDRGRQVAVGAPHEVLQADMIQAVYGLSISVIPHPHISCPLVVTLATDWANST